MDSNIHSDLVLVICNVDFSLHIFILSRMYVYIIIWSYIPIWLSKNLNILISQCLTSWLSKRRHLLTPSVVRLHVCWTRYVRTFYLSSNLNQIRHKFVLITSKNEIFCSYKILVKHYTVSIILSKPSLYYMKLSNEDTFVLSSESTRQSRCFLERNDSLFILNGCYVKKKKGTDVLGLFLICYMKDFLSEFHFLRWYEIPFLPFMLL